MRFTLPFIVLSCAMANAVQADEPSREAMIARGVEILLDMQEGETKAEWPYEGVYRVSRTIPVGYRVGGTAIAAAALLHAPGLADDAPRQAAIHRAIRFIADSIDDHAMIHHVEATYDVRGWGYAYGLWFLAQAKAMKIIPDDLAPDVEKTMAFFIKGIEITEIPSGGNSPGGGWNYARRGGFQGPGSSSPFMTGATLQALFEAAKIGMTINDAVIERGLAALQASKMESGAYVYSGRATARSSDGVPGAVGRMLIAESTLFLAGRATAADVRGALDAFIVHWDWLEQRRAQDGTHSPPYGVAPYYFFFAHHYAAQAIELLPRHERAEYRRRVNALLLKVREEGGGWNDRTFPRSRNYGTAMAMLALMMPDLPRPAGWSAKEASTSGAE
ncbi:MAG TPA: terpene cyclase/mutase family protein [Phycisphaerales bacterium]|nr:terpene cyclase/mutase family protein [Phycisphaerales bacterium]HRQ76890.1 terpene cyclase/mutase family protein [Phycisphaerales bacterium]